MQLPPPVGASSFPTRRIVFREACISVVFNQTPGIAYQRGRCFCFRLRLLHPERVTYCLGRFHCLEARLVSCHNSRARERSQRCLEDRSSIRTRVQRTHAAPCSQGRKSARFSNGRKKEKRREKRKRRKKKRKGRKMFRRASNTLHKTLFAFRTLYYCAQRIY